MTPRRVLHVAQPTEAGVARVVEQYAVAQQADGSTVSVAGPEGPLAVSLRAAGIAHHRWDATRQPGPAVLGETRALARIIAEVDPDVVHLHSAKAGLAGRLAVRGRRHTVFQPHAWSFEAVTGPTHHGAVVWERYAARWADVLLFVSEAERDAGVRHGIRGHAVVLPNSVDPWVWRPRDGHLARTELGLPPDVPIAVCVGRLSEQKGQHDLLDVWTAVVGLVPDALLVLVGDGPDAPDLLARAPQSVRLTGATSDVSTWYAAADIVVMPSRWEAMAMVPLEAEASARVVVATGVAGVAESLSPNSIIVAPGDASAMTSALVRLLSDPAGARARGWAAREHVACRTRVDVAVELERTYRQATRLPASSGAG